MGRIDVSQRGDFALSNGGVRGCTRGIATKLAARNFTFMERYLRTADRSSRRNAAIANRDGGRRSWGETAMERLEACWTSAAE
jgi:hypothetical protein